MRTHQRYFAMEDADGQARAALRDDDGDDRQGSGASSRRATRRVLAARLSDAKFFFAEDRKKSFDDWNAKLDGVVFQAKLGDAAKTIGHKVQRIGRRSLAARRRRRRRSPSRPRAARKADLASHAVGEFPELQGMMGRHYAQLAGARRRGRRRDRRALWPQGAGRRAADDRRRRARRARRSHGHARRLLRGRPRAERLGRSVRSAPRRDRHLADPARPRLDASTDALAAPSARRDAAAPRRASTLKDRKRARRVLPRAPARHLRRPGHPGAGRRRGARAGLHAIRSTRAPARSRCAKIPQGGARGVQARREHPRRRSGKKIAIGDEPDPALFVAPTTSSTTCTPRSATRRRARPTRATKRDYAAVFESLEQLQPDVAAFFDKGGVMVMDPDPKLRDNRLALLELVHRAVHRDRRLPPASQALPS